MIPDEELAETRAFNAQLEALLRGVTPANELPVEAVRQARRDGRGPLPAPVFLDTARMDSVEGRIPVRVFQPAAPQGAYLHLHGGGWTLGACDLQDPLLQAVADEAALTVVSVEYRLAPEHPYPAAPDDCEAAALWFLERFDGRLAIGGESAGAHLSVVTLLRLRDRHGISPRRFAAANLVFGAYDLSGTPSRRRWDRDLILSAPLMDWFTDGFLEHLPLEERRQPDISPLYADLTDLPPALFTCGTLDPLLDDSLFMHARWAAAGNESRLSLYREGIHAFTAFPIEIGYRSRAEQVAFLRG